MEIITTDWTGRTGEHRRYIQNVPELIGLTLTRYRTGNIRLAVLDGQVISNTRATELANVAAWFDEAETLHVEARWQTPRELTLDEITRRIAAHQ